jgi:hypothetical protein
VARGARRPFWTLDCESDPFKVGRVPQPFIWGLFGGESGEEYHEFDTGAEVVAFLERLNHVVYAHNGGKFDYHYLKEYVNTGSLQHPEPISIIAGRLARFKIGECEFRDSMNILPVALATFKKDEVDYAMFEKEERDKPANREKIRRYLQTDCRYLYELIAVHRKENGIALTQAGASMRAWSKSSGIKPPRQSASDYQLYRPFYYGGRVQCFASGVKRTQFKVIDINSAYPFAMLSPHPYSTHGARQAHLPPDGELHRCLITLKCTARGCFPFRMGEDPTRGDLYFPYDEKTIRRYHVTGYEFIAALKRDAIRNISIETVHYFEETVKFQEFILENWDRRARAKAEGNKALDIICKLLMNSLYGKFASDYAKYKDYMICALDDLIELVRDGWEEDSIWCEGKRLIAKAIPEEKHRFYNIATAASITGYVRAMLFEALCDVSEPIYCDTDSIAAGDTGSCVMGDGLGAWKLEGEFDEYAIAGKKTYAFHKKGAGAGVECDARGDYLNYKAACKGVDLDPHQITKAALGEKVRHSPEVPTYSVKRERPIFVPRDVKLTAKDIRNVPEEV